MTWRNTGEKFESSYEEFEVKDGLKSGNILEMLKYWYEVHRRPQLTFCKSHVLISEANQQLKIIKFSSVAQGTALHS